MTDAVEVNVVSSTLLPVKQESCLHSRLRCGRRPVQQAARERSGVTVATSW